MNAQPHTDQRFRDETTLLRLVEHLSFAAADAAKAPSAADLEDNRPLLNSVAMELIQAQEAANQLSDAFISEIPDLPWPQLRGLRNIIVHEYDAIDADELYRTVTVDVPHLIELLQPIVDDIE
ncbi:putative toxin-antitoxin system, antitoxin component [Bifidobacterium pullorum subsp. gallinarum]|uniref:Putative toxin-antitoxin system, antitoxin component n=1 Tax=Bifidobacterium pullorum subsp. gallinarum TaxID=78344 RepID=A0A087ASN7_9BIFI|nr:HepT-like ribonuclease domain-containing protein [Bifidobacterium pullorum]KFI61787.1 putative toxin-antitoxin system, antitoxin component [Bifidobacterium pullorum subsp. gallinarum]